MTSPPLLFAATVSPAPANSPAAAVSGTGLTGSQTEGTAGGDFLASFLPLMQPKVSGDWALADVPSTEIPPTMDALALVEGLTPETANLAVSTLETVPCLSDVGLAWDEHSQSLIRVENATGLPEFAEGVTPTAEEAGAVLVAVAPLEPLEPAQTALALEPEASLASAVAPENLSPTVMAGDGIPADASALPPIAATTVTDPAQPELPLAGLSPDLSSAPVNPEPPVVTAFDHFPPEKPALTEKANAGKRLDLTQWLSRPSPDAASDTPEEAAQSGLTTAAGTSSQNRLLAENPDALLKNTLFARALSHADATARLESPELEVPAPAAMIRPATSLQLAQLPADTGSMGRMTLPLNISFGHPQWPEALAERAGQLAHQRVYSAEMQLDPPELGPLQVKISVHQDQAVVSFVSANPQVRDLLDQNLVRLRELLQEQGMQLVDAGVSDQQREPGENAGTKAGDFAGTTAEDSLASDSVETHTSTQLAWGVDDFV